MEDRLKEVMCRTERNWYLEDAAKAINSIAQYRTTFVRPLESR